MAGLNFVAVEDGLEDDPKFQGLCRVLKKTRPVVLWFIVRLRRLILRRGNHLAGTLPKDFTADDIASFLEFPGSASRLIEALKRQGYLGYKKGRGYFYPRWRDEITGRYTARREEDRIFHERARLAARQSAVLSSTDVARRSTDTSSDSRTTSPRSPTVRNEESERGLPPDPPPDGGASVADARWNWIMQNAPTPQNRDGCKRLLQSMPEGEWTLVENAYGLLHKPGAAISRKDRRVLQWPTDQFLRKQVYLRFQQTKRPARTTTQPPSGNGETGPAEDLATRLAAADTFVTELLNDPDTSEAKKSETRARWSADPQNKNRRPPWESAN